MLSLPAPATPPVSLRTMVVLLVLVLLVAGPFGRGSATAQPAAPAEPGPRPVELLGGQEQGTVTIVPQGGEGEAEELEGEGEPVPEPPPTKGRRFTITLPEPREEKAGVLELGLADAIRMALENNLSLRIQLLNPLIEETRVLEAMSAFDSVLFLQSVLEGKQNLLISPTSIDPISLAPIREQSRADNFVVSAGIRKPLGAGGVFVTQLSAQRHRFNAPGPTRDIFGRLVRTPVINPSVTTHLTFSVQQPILRGGGREVAQAPIKITRLSRDAARLDYQSEVINIIGSVARAYWELVYQRKLLRVRVWSLNAAQDLYDATKEAVDFGTLPLIELDRAAGEVALRKTQLVSAQTAVGNAEDRLRRLLRGSAEELSTETYLRLTDSPELEHQPLDEKRAIYTALMRRPDLQAAKEQAKANTIRLTVAKNQLLPTLDLGASYTINGLGGNLSSALWSRTHEPLKEQGLFKSQFHDFRLFLNFEVPFGRRQAKSQYTRTELAILHQLLQIKDLEEQIVFDIREAVRTVNSSLKQAETAAYAQELAQRRLDAEEEQYRAGTGRSLDVLDAQTEVALAEAETLRAVFSYRVAMISLAQRQGTLLEEFLAGPVSIEYPGP